MSRTTKKLLVIAPVIILLALILWGDNDRVLHMSGAKILESVMPNAKSVIMKNVGHVPMVKIPEESANIFLKFLGK